MVQVHLQIMLVFKLSRSATNINAFMLHVLPHTHSCYKFCHTTVYIHVNIDNESSPQISSLSIRFSLNNTNYKPITHTMSIIPIFVGLIFLFVQLRPAYFVNLVQNKI